MKFEDKLNDIFDEISIPDELSPQNIAFMLKAKTEQSKMAAEHKNIKSAPSITAQRRTIIMRTVAATAACTAIAVGMLAYKAADRDANGLGDRTLYQDIKPIIPDSYDTLYDIYTGISLESSEIASEKNTSTETSENSSETDNTIPSETNITSAESAISGGTTATITYDFSDNDDVIHDERVINADIVKTDGENIYCITDGTLYVFDINTMEVITSVECGSAPPYELYIDGDTLILISTETNEIQYFDTDASVSGTNDSAPDESVPADNSDSNSTGDQIEDTSSYNSNESAQSSDTNNNGGDNSVFKSGAAYPGTTALTRSNAVINLYDISDKTTLSHTATYKQNGSYVSTILTGGTLYTVTSYSDYRVKPLDNQSELDSFVPAYFLNDEKYYVAVDDIIIPSNAKSTDYTVVSAINLRKPMDFISVNAVLGSSKNVYCSADSLYIASENSVDNSSTSITRFSLNNSGAAIIYSSSTSVEGIAKKYFNMNDDDNYFRFSAQSKDKNGVISTSLYVLDKKTLTAVNSAAQLLPDCNIESVRFKENLAFLYKAGNYTPEMVIDLSSSPPVQVNSLDQNTPYLTKCFGSNLLGLSVENDENGNPCGLSLSMYSSDGCLLLNNVKFANDLSNVNSNALYSRQALFIDTANSLIGVPAYGHHAFGTINRYYLFSYDSASGFVPKGNGFIEYTDIDDSSLFKRAIVNGDVFYAIGNGRIVSAQLSDLKVIDSFSY